MNKEIRIILVILSIIFIIWLCFFWTEDKQTAPKQNVLPPKAKVVPQTQEKPGAQAPAKASMPTMSDQESASSEGMVDQSRQAGDQEREEPPELTRIIVKPNVQVDGVNVGKTLSGHVVQGDKVVDDEHLTNQQKGGEASASKSSD